MDEGGSVDEVSLCMKRLWERVWGSSFPGDPGRCVGKVFGNGHLSLYGGPFSVEGNLVCVGGGSYTRD
jgi:hypothetical protein